MVYEGLKADIQLLVKAGSRSGIYLMRSPEA